jgi:plasmid stabilization system protein ParE
LSYRVRYTAEARADLLRLYEFLLARDAPAARRALVSIRKAAEMLESFPYTCRKAEPDNAYLRELVVSFGDAGYVALFEIEDERTVNILAVRHQREDDYH